MRAWCGIWLAGCFIWLAACGATTPPSLDTSPTAGNPNIVGADASTSAAETPGAPTPVVTNDAVAFPTRAVLPSERTPSNDPASLTLTLWVPEEFGTGAERGGDVLERQIAEFQVARPKLNLNFVLKAPYGKGGIVDWITQLDELMPERLPDAAIVDSRELDQLEKLGLLHPLQHALPSGAYWELFPPAQQIARRNGQWNNQPLTLDTELLVFASQAVSVPPATWDQVLASKTQFAFAADSTDTFLFHYLENGGSVNPTLHPAQDASVMQVILDYFQRARANGNLTENTAVMKSAREVMPLLVTGQTPMAQVRARDFLSERSRLSNAIVAPIPTRDGRASALVSAWSFVILTEDPLKRDAALEYLAWMIDPTRFGEWARAALLMPAGKSAFAQALNSEAANSSATDSQDTADVFRNLFQNALVAPSFSAQAPYADAWHTAVNAVLSGQLSPEDAAFRALQSITQ